ncbi:M1 family metallopeptidase [Nannocystaceae bacterium ST9]
MPGLAAFVRLLPLALLASACSPGAPTPREQTPAPTPMASHTTSAPTPPTPPAEDPIRQAARLRTDPHSLARPDQVLVEHVGLALRVDFATSTLRGEAILALDRRDASAPLRLDTAGLDVQAVAAAKLDVAAGDQGVIELAPLSKHPAFVDVQFRYEPAPGQPELGQALVVDVPEGMKYVRISYATTPSATGLQWLTPEQTAGKRLPFLYSQSQAIHARSWIPSQDSPGVRTTWDAAITVDDRFTPVMAAGFGQALPDEQAGEHAFRFVMAKPVPAYLIAIGVGDLERREIGPRTAVWADPSVVEAAASEFADMESMLVSAEQLYGPYAWGRYDVLVLPPAFPFGGMENPCMTFATPTIIAGDRSLVSLIAHELAHSWSGNLVTNRTWGDLWLNEGFTVYFERRIVEAIFGRERAELEARIGKRELLAELADPELLANTPELQRLRTDIAGLDADANFSTVPYEKGALLLRALEDTYGRERFDAFLRAWFDAHAFGSVSTDDFLNFVGLELIGPATPLPGKRPPDLAAWIDGAGLPADAPEPTSASLDAVEQSAKQWFAGSLALADITTEGWSAWHWLHFLRSLPSELGNERMVELDRAFGLSASGNAEILGQWLVLVARERHEPGFAELERFLIEVGRRKFLTPIYRALLTSEAGKTQAQAIYAKARPGYHAISRATIDELVGVPPAGDP